MSSAQSCVVSRKGSIFVGWLSLETDVFAAIGLAFLIHKEEWWLLWLSLAIQIVHSVMSIVLLIGISKDIVAFIKAFVLVNTAFIVYCVVISLTYFITAFSPSTDGGENIIFGVVYLFQSFIAVYYTISIRSYAISLEEDSMKQGLLPYQQGQSEQIVFQQEKPDWKSYQTLQIGQPGKPGWQSGQPVIKPVQLEKPVLHL